jgi:hypothetical protein
MPCPAKELGGVGLFVAMFRFESKGKTFVAAVSGDGARVHIARSGTACRAPTVGNGEGTIPRVAPSIGSCGALLRWHRRRFHDRLTGGACATENLLDYYCGLASGYGRG